MRIGIFTDTYPPLINGVSTSVSVLEKALENLGHQVYIVTVNNKSTKYSYEKDGKIVRIPAFATGIYDYRLSSIYPIKVIKKIKKWNLDVIHAQTEFGVGTFSRIISKQFDIPLIYTYHTMYEDYLSSITKGKFTETINSFIEYVSDYYCDSSITELIVPTKKTYDLFKEKYKYTRNIHIIPNGIELEKFYVENVDKKNIIDLKEQYKISKEDFCILYVGRLGQEKNTEFLVECQIEILKKHKNCKLIIVGDGPYYNKLNKMVVKNKISDNVIFTGKVPLNKIQYYYQLASVFATASQFETQGLTVIEALASSVPVLCIKDESFINTVIPSLNGDMFNNKEEYINYIDSYIKNPEILKKYKIQARNSSEIHSSKYFAERVLKVYDLAIQKNGKHAKNFTKRFAKVVGGVIKNENSSR